MDFAQALEIAERYLTEIQSRQPEKPRISHVEEFELA